METRLYIMIAALILILLFFIYRNIIKNKLSLQYSMLWIFLSLALLITTLIPENIMLEIANFCGFELPSNLMFFAAIIVIMIIQLHITKIISVQRKKIDTLVQELAIIKNKVDINEKNNK